MFCLYNFPTHDLNFYDLPKFSGKNDLYIFFKFRWCLATKHDFFQYFNEVQNKESGIPNYYLSFTMILGACVAGKI